jgi:hypothetical protein
VGKFFFSSPFPPGIKIFFITDGLIDDRPKITDENFTDGAILSMILSVN